MSLVDKNDNIYDNNNVVKSDHHIKASRVWCHCKNFGVHFGLYWPSKMVWLQMHGWTMNKYNQEHDTN